ncbi:hypothetical protein [Andreprevotia chitinilytica]|uniref:hypothetical protein n=1 Tax=Andreprevotia chitinilytica TaxID=396808 RepID=UPI00068F9F01|nr:hypothetical protein [Andreprevotia chitinilytica]
MRAATKFICYALAITDLIVLAYFLLANMSAWQPDTWLLIHLFLVLSQTLLLLPGFSMLYPKQQGRVLLVLLPFGVLLPGIGSFGLVIAAELALRFPEQAQAATFRVLPVPEFTLRTAQREVRYGIGGVRARLADPHAPSESRLNALLTLNAMPQRLSSGLLRDLLDDPEEDLRLLAYGMLDQEEKRINAQINTAMQTYRDETGDHKVDAARRLAYLYWEQVYQGVVQGDVRQYVLAQAIRYADEVLAVLPAEAELWVLRGKVLSANGDTERAWAAYLCARAMGYPEVRLLPYLAEHAFARRDFADVRSLIGDLDPLHLNDTMAPVARFWRKPAGSDKAETAAQALQRIREARRDRVKPSGQPSANQPDSTAGEASA